MNSIILISVKMLSTVIGFITIVLLSSHLDPYSFAHLSVILTVLNFTGVVSSFGISTHILSASRKSLNYYRSLTNGIMAGNATLIFIGIILSSLYLIITNHILCCDSSAYITIMVIVFYVISHIFNTVHEFLILRLVNPIMATTFTVLIRNFLRATLLIAVVFSLKTSGNFQTDYYVFIFVGTSLFTAMSSYFIVMITTKHKQEKTLGLQENKLVKPISNVAKFCEFIVLALVQAGVLIMQPMVNSTELAQIALLIQAVIAFSIVINSTSLLFISRIIEACDARDFNRVGKLQKQISKRSFAITITASMILIIVTLSFSDSNFLNELQSNALMSSLYLIPAFLISAITGPVYNILINMGEHKFLVLVHSASFFIFISVALFSSHQLGELSFVAAYSCSIVALKTSMWFKVKIKKES